MDGDGYLREVFLWRWVILLIGKWVWHKKCPPAQKKIRKKQLTFWNLRCIVDIYIDLVDSACETPRKTSLDSGSVYASMFYKQDPLERVFFRRTEKKHQTIHWKFIWNRARGLEDTLQGTNPYPTWGSSEHHRLKYAKNHGDMLISWRAHFFIFFQTVMIFRFQVHLPGCTQSWRSLKSVCCSHEFLDSNSESSPTAVWGVYICFFI